jgi:hypothetical protein
MLRFTVFGRLLARMATTKTSISLSAVDLAASAPEIGTPDLTELRIVIRRFPKDAGERDCYRHLLEQMQATPENPRGTKAGLEDTCRERFDVTVESFNYCWNEAIKVSGANWNQPGRRAR